MEFTTLNYRDKVKRTVRKNPNVKEIVVTLSLNINSYTISVNTLKLILDAITNGFGDEVKRVLLLIKMFLTKKISCEKFICQIQKVIEHSSSKNVWVASIVGNIKKSDLRRCNVCHLGVA